MLQVSGKPTNFHATSHYVARHIRFRVFQAYLLTLISHKVVTVVSFNTQTSLHKNKQAVRIRFHSTSQNYLKWLAF
jgi:hypothetical protein